MRTVSPHRSPARRRLGSRSLAAALLASVAAALPARAAPDAAAPASAAAAGGGSSGRVLVSGVVGDERTRQAVLARLRELYGSERVDDRLGVGQVVAPPQWGDALQRLLRPELQQVRDGELSVLGRTVELKGEVASEALRRSVAERLSAELTPAYTLRNALRVAAPDGQAQVDAALADRIVEFEPGSATLTATGQAVLDALVPILAGLPDRRFEITGHTDASGSRPANLVLSAARAEAVKAYLVARRLRAESIGTAGAGPDRPVADNASAEGRARNRRIEFRVAGP